MIAKMKKSILLLVMALGGASGVQAQSEIYPKHFDLSEVKLIDGSPFTDAMHRNSRHLLEYDTERLLTPFVVQSGLNSTNDKESPYYQWSQKHPAFLNWGDASFDLSGHVAGHYLSALALAAAAETDAVLREQLLQRLEQMLQVMDDCQQMYDSNTLGLKGFLGGQPILDSWQGLYNGNVDSFTRRGGWVPLYCQHKVLAGLRDAYLYAGNERAKEMFRKLADWSVDLVSKLSDTQMATVLNIEHGGMNESLADAYQLFGDSKYLDAAKKYSHQTMVSGMQTLNKTFLNGKHANTQVPKYIGFERVAELDASATRYMTATRNFWDDVALHRTTCIGGNSVNEHFLSVDACNRYIDNLDGPESCNTNNMLKLSEMLSDYTGDAKYADFYEYATWNHILSTQDPTTGGYVYFTTLRPQGYRIYSQVNQGMWCCVGTGMENHSKYGHFIYTHEGNSKLYVNLFVASELNDETFAVCQETNFPYSPNTKLTIRRSGEYTLCVRHPAWTTADYSVAVNGAKQDITVKTGTASYVEINRKWQAGDIVEVQLPMALRYAECPNYTDYIAFQYGPILLAGQTTAASDTEAESTGLQHEALQNEYAGAGRMDHAPGSMAKGISLTQSPMLIGERKDVLNRIKLENATDLTFRIDASRPDVQTYKWNSLSLKPFYTIHHARYMAYWLQLTEEQYAQSDIAQSEAIAEALLHRTLDFVAPGEQQSEAGHEYSYSSNSSTGTYNSETYRDAKANGYVQYTLYNKTGVKDSLAIMLRFTTADAGRKGTLKVDGVKIADITVPQTAPNMDSNGFYNVEYPIPANLVCDSEGNVKSGYKVRLTASSATMMPGLYYMRLVRGYDNHAYQFVCTDWTTGDANRLAAGKINYDETANTLSMRQTGSNNIALMMKYVGKQYTIAKEQKYLVVKGKHLSLKSGASYLWWLNGINKASQVAPSLTRTTDDGYQVVAWDMSKSGLNANITGDRPNVCMGQTIFGLTSSSTDGYTEIHYIGYAEDVDDEITGIAALRPASPEKYYTLQGLTAPTNYHGVVVSASNGKKVVK